MGKKIKTLSGTGETGPTDLKSDLKLWARVYYYRNSLV